MFASLSNGSGTVTAAQTGVRLAAMGGAARIYVTAAGHAGKIDVTAAGHAGKIARPAAGGVANAVLRDIAERSCAHAPGISTIASAPRFQVTVEIAG